MSVRRTTALALPLALCALTQTSAPARQPPVAAEWRAALTEAYRALSARQFNLLNGSLGRARYFARQYPSHRYAAKTLEYGALELMLQFRYGEATREYLRARQAAATAGDRATEAGAMHALSNLYWQAGNLAAARQASEQALAILPPQTVPLLAGGMRNHFARVLARSGRTAEAQALFTEVVTLARQHGLRLLEADAWKLSSRERALQGELEAARQALEQSIDIRRAIGDGELASDYHDRADVEIRAGRAGDALSWLDRAEAEAHRARRFVTWRIDVARGRAHLELGETAAALAELRRADRLRRESRTFLLPGDWLRAHSNGAAEDPFELLVDAALGEHTRNRDPALLAEAFAASEERRAWSLRAADRQMRIPAERARLYWQTVGEFDDAYAALMRQTPGSRSAAERRLEALRLRLAEIEAGGEGGEPGVTAGNAGPPRLPALGPDEALIALQVGERRSWAFTVTGERLEVTPLPPRAVLESKVARWLQALEDPAAALEVYRVVLASLPAGVRRARKWLIAAEGVFHGVPWAALRTEGPAYLIEQHALQLVPGSWALGRREPARRTGGFLGLGDPIYNQADARATPPARWPWRVTGPEDRAPNAQELSRLAGSGIEVERCARLWPWAHRLTGAQATPERLAESLTGSSHAVVHLATHVVPAPDTPEENLIALGHGSDGWPSYVGPEWIGARRLDRSLVVMNGCRSGTGVITAEGLMGLSRAWLRAGASRVLTTYWPTRDDAGALVQVFYRQLQRGGEHAEALRQAQLAMISQGGWQGQPRHWAAYFLVGHPE